jgi:hypothetical protein
MGQMEQDWGGRKAEAKVCVCKLILSDMLLTDASSRTRVQTADVRGIVGAARARARIAKR